MIDIGQMNELEVHRKLKSCYLLRATDFDIDVTLPIEEVEGDLEIGDRVEVFVYVGSKDEPVTSLKKPKAMVGDYFVASVVENHQFGSFVDWGISKDLLIPDTEQKERMGVDRFYIIKVCLDERTNKVYGTTKIGKYLEDTTFDIKVKDRVKVIPAKKEELGFRSLVNGKYIGMIYYNEVFQYIELGKELDGIVKKIRPDNLVDISLQKLGIGNLEDSQSVIINYLSLKGGKSPLNDKSSPEDIRRELKMSKKTFKSAIGMLYKKKQILIHSDGIELNYKSRK
ncbi:MAG: GntR family transcriptional regulator [Halobacteriovoraceae bacterium]|nr:GntR family transcriptional regulator [Halobacteriovoraceae bacterium]